METGFRFRERPLSATERADLERQAYEAEQFMLSHRLRLWKRQLRIAMVILPILAGAWVYLANEVPASSLSSMLVVGSLGAFALWAVISKRRVQGRIDAVRKQWSKVIAECESNPVFEADVVPLRALKLDRAYLFDVGDGWGFYFEPFEDNWKPTERFVFRWASSGIKWVDSMGAPIGTVPLWFDWSSLPHDHALVQFGSPAMFRFEGDPVAAIRAFEEGGFPFGEDKRNGSWSPVEQGSCAG
jgi:hypothetical protein